MDYPALARLRNFGRFGTRVNLVCLLICIPLGFNSYKSVCYRGAAWFSVIFYAYLELYGQLICRWADLGVRDLSVASSDQHVLFYSRLLSWLSSERFPISASWKRLSMWIQVIESSSFPITVPNTISTRTIQFPHVPIAWNKNRDCEITCAVISASQRFHEMAKSLLCVCECALVAHVSLVRNTSGN